MDIFDYPAVGLAGMFIFGVIAVAMLRKGDGQPWVVVPILAATVSFLQFVPGAVVYVLRALQ